MREGCLPPPPQSRRRLPPNRVLVPGFGLCNRRISPPGTPRAQEGADSAPPTPIPFPRRGGAPTSIPFLPPPRGGPPTPIPFPPRGGRGQGLGAFGKCAQWKRAFGKCAQEMRPVVEGLQEMRPPVPAPEAALWPPIWGGSTMRSIGGVGHPILSLPYLTAPTTAPPF